MTDFAPDIKEMSELLGEENINCLTNLFEATNGNPPYLDKKRYRANNPEQINTLEHLEHTLSLIETETNKTQSFYRVRTYAIPLINSKKAKRLLNLMEELYKKFPAIYKEQLDTTIKRNDFLKRLSVSDDKDILEALYYFKDTHSIWGGWGKDFPYEENSHINLDEKVLIKESILEILTDYYRWNFIKDKSNKKIEPNLKKENYIPEVKVEEGIVGRPTYEEEVIGAYDLLKGKGIINYEKSFRAHIDPIYQTILSVYGLDVSDKVIEKYLCKPIFQKEKKIYKERSMETSRCIIRPLTPNNREDLKNIFLSSSVRKYLGGAISEDTFDSKFKNMLNDAESIYWVAKLKTDNSFIGLISIDNHHNNVDKDISYQLSENMQGIGLGSELVSRIIKFAFKKMSLNRLVAETQSENIPSVKILQKAGMTLENEVKRFGAKQSIYSIEKIPIN